VDNAPPCHFERSSCFAHAQLGETLPPHHRAAALPCACSLSPVASARTSPDASSTSVTRLLEETPFPFRPSGVGSGAKLAEFHNVPSAVDGVFNVLPRQHVVPGA
jgi:hypothetical protein